MNAALLALVTISLFAIGYRYYSRFLERRVFFLDKTESVPSKNCEDGIDFVASNKYVLWGHHFTSIAGAAPIVGPAIAVIWGWLPALVWVVVGTIFLGAVHDFSALVISLRHRGRSIGEIAGTVIGPRTRTLFLLIISLLIWIVLAVFAYIIATLFIGNPGAIFPINLQIIIAIILGWLVYRRRITLAFPSLIGYIILLVAIFYGNDFAAQYPFLTKISIETWVWLLLGYSFVSSVLPVWILLQPRDYLNAHQLITGLILLIAGLVVLQPTVVAPAVNLYPEGAPPIIPFLFITIACGAISGFHGLVASGTTSKQVSKMSHARPIGYGAMLGEGTLGMLAVLASTAGFATAGHWTSHYSSWGAANSLASKLDAFVTGGATFIAALGIPIQTGRTFIAVMVIAFAATSLDTGARIQRLIIAELADHCNLRIFTNRYASSALGITLALLLALTQAGGNGGLALWPLFGTTNQLIAGATLLVVSVWLRKQGRPFLYTLLPMIFVGTTTIISMVGEVSSYYTNFSSNWGLALLGSAILIANLWILFEGLRLLSPRK